MQQQPEPNAAVPIAEPAEKDTGGYRGKSFGYRLAEMDHAVRHGHREDRVKSERRLQAVNDKSAKEKLESEKLNKVYQFPREKRRAEIRFTVEDLEEWILSCETSRLRHQVNQRQHHRRDRQIQFPEAVLDAETKAVISQLLLK